MLEIEEITPKFTRIYRCPDDVTNLKIRIKLRAVDDDFVEVKEIKWQEKLFSRTERDYYNDASNCLTDLEKTYHDAVRNLVENEHNLISTYIHDDGYSNNNTDENVTRLCAAVQDCKIDARAEFSNDYEEMLAKSMENPLMPQYYQEMKLIADFGEFYDNVWLKSEYVLCSLKYDQSKKLLMINPDFTKHDAHIIKIHTDKTKKYEFYLENASLDGVTLTELAQEAKIFDEIALYDKQLRSEHLYRDEDFTIPPINKLHLFLMLEILSAQHFEHDNIYVQYHIDLPDGWSLHTNSVDALTGITPAAKSTTSSVFFGIPYEVFLEYSVQTVGNTYKIPEPCVYFQVIAKDTWSRYRCEGLCYQQLPINQPGVYDYQLNCLRITSNSISTNLRRFFIGDNLNYNDIRWINNIPVDDSTNLKHNLNKFGASTIGSGVLSIRMQLIEQSQAFIINKNEISVVDQRGNSKNNAYERLMLYKSIDSVLQAFKRSRQSMADARRQLMLA